jgi:NADH-quinone oxidoreductase subunit H
MAALFSILVFPGFFFLSFFGMWMEFFDRRIYARLQNRKGPPWFQPLADFIKLIAKEDLVPTEANEMFFRGAPLVALTAVVTSFLYIPIWGPNALFSFNGDLIVVLYLLTLPTLAYFIGGWYSTSLFARIGSMRTVTQHFAYEVPLLMGMLAPAILAGTWSISAMSAFYMKHPNLALFNLIAFVVCLIAIQGKLEKAPFDIPEAETEIVAGGFTEYSGRLFAILRLTMDMELIVCCSLLAAVFLPFGLACCPFSGFIIYLIKVIALVFIFSLARTVLARMRIDQMINFCWQYLVPLSLLQIFINILLKGFAS